MLDRERMLHWQAEREDADRKWRDVQREKDDTRRDKDEQRRTIERTSNNRWRFAEISVLALGVVAATIIALVAAVVGRDEISFPALPTQPAIVAEALLTPTPSPELTPIATELQP